MGRFIKVLAFSVVFTFLNISLSVASPVWQKAGAGIREPEVTAVAVSPSDPSLIFAGTDKAIYKSINQGKEFALALLLSGQEGRVNFLYISPQEAASVYAATDGGLYVSKNNGEKWERIFYSNKTDERRCFGVAVVDDFIYAATAGGLFYRPVKGMFWQQAKGRLNRLPIYFIATLDTRIYLASGDEVFSVDKNVKNIEVIVSNVSHELAIEAGEDADEEPQAATQQIIKFMGVSAEGGGRLYVATVKGIFFRDNGSKDWQKLASDGIPMEDITSLTVKGGGILLSTAKGVFFYENGQWEQIYQGMETSRVNFLAGDGGGNFYAAADKGVFILDSGKALSYGTWADYRKMQEVFKAEPAVADVQKMAVDYAEVNPDKIKNWRAGAQKRAWLPSMSLNLDQDKNKTVGDSIYGTYTGGGQSYVGPRDKTFYDNLGWGVSFSWDLADLVWSSDQTSIDSRSKLMVELREDILDQVTRLYFERRRLQLEMSQGALLDDQMKIDKAMRIAELTALLDGFTGGGFSRENKKENQN